MLIVVVHLELNWLPTSILKGGNCPTILFDQDSTYPYSGYYVHGSGILTIVDPTDIQATVAHELKHYLQEQVGINIDAPEFNTSLPYEKAIAQFYTNSLVERQALEFEYKYAKNPTNEWWLRKLVLENSTKKITHKGDK